MDTGKGFGRKGLRILMGLVLAFALASWAAAPAEAGRKYSDYDRRDRDRLCAGNCNSIMDRDLRNYCNGNCDFINDRDLRTICRERPFDTDEDKDHDDGDTDDSDEEE